jgi:hypothetical protein
MNMAFKREDLMAYDRRFLTVISNPLGLPSAKAPNQAIVLLSTVT